MYAALRTPPPLHFSLPAWLFLATWIGILALFASMFWAVVREKRKRREALQRFALESGFNFFDQPEPDLAARLVELNASPMSLQIDARYANVLRGSIDGQDAVIADRSVREGKGRATTTVVAVHCEPSLPPFFLCTENILYRLAEKVGYSDINLESAPVFSRRYLLHSDKPEQVRAIFTRDVTAVFEELPEKHGLYFQASGAWLAVYRANRTLPVSELHDVLTIAGKVSAAFRRAQRASAAKAF